MNEFILNYSNNNNNNNTSSENNNNNNNNNNNSNSSSSLLSSSSFHNLSSNSLSNISNNNNNNNNNNNENKNKIIEKRNSFNNLKEFRRKDSAVSTTSSTEALDFLADMCVEIDEIGTSMIMASPANGNNNYNNKEQKFFPSNFLLEKSPIPSPTEQISLTQNNNNNINNNNNSNSNGSSGSNKLKRECAEISPRSRSSLTPASNISRTLSKGFSFSSVGSNPFMTDRDEALAILNGSSHSFEDERIVIPLTLYNYGDDGIFLVPNNPNDIAVLIKEAKSSNTQPLYSITVSEADNLQQNTQLKLFSKLSQGIRSNINTSTSSLPIATTSLLSTTNINTLNNNYNNIINQNQLINNNNNNNININGHNHVHTPGINNNYHPQHSSLHHNQLNSVKSSPSVNDPPIKLMNPKHIYKTSCDTYRVQMSKGTKANPNGKFSRNTRTEVDALWLCEFALLLIERPSNFDDILINGNYKCLLQRKLVSSPEDFAVRLYQQLTELSSRGLLKPPETEKLAILLQKFVPQYGFGYNGTPIDVNLTLSNDSALPFMYHPERGLVHSSSTNSPDGLFAYPPAPQPKTILHKAKAGISSLLNPFQFSDADQKKRRRSTPAASSLSSSSSSSSNQLHDNILPGRLFSSASASNVLSSTSNYSSSLSSPNINYHNNLNDNNNNNNINNNNNNNNNISNNNISSTSSPVFLQQNSLPHPHLQHSHSQPQMPPHTSSSNIRQYPELSVLTAKYVKQKSRSFDESNSPSEHGSNRYSPPPPSPNLSTSTSSTTRKIV